MFRNRLASLMVLTLLLWTGGCSNSPTEPSANENLNLEEEFGGYTASPEAPGFDDPELVEEATNDTAYGDDETLNCPKVDSVLACPHLGYYHLRAVWGKLHFDSTVTTVTDWTGSLTVSRGVEIIRRVIRFEPGQDYIVRPRTDSKIVEWVSKTTVHNDGIALDIFVPLRFDTAKVVEIDSLGDTSYVLVIDTVHSAIVSFQTGPYSRTFELSELGALDTIVYLDDSNAVAFDAFELDHRPCPRGFLAGRWGYDRNGQGRFHGIWWSRSNLLGWHISGYLKGHFGRNSAGEDVFFGKWISRTGEFKGFLKGTYGDRPTVTDVARRRARGWFAGHIYSAQRVTIGVLEGRYRSAPWYEDGFLQGRWKLYCNAAEPDSLDGKEGF